MITENFRLMIPAFIVGMFVSMFSLDLLDISIIIILLTWLLMWSFLSWIIFGVFVWLVWTAVIGTYHAIIDD